MRVQISLDLFPLFLHFLDAIGRTYLFDLDFAVENGNAAFVIDAAKYGNVSHFINHSVG